MKDKSNQTIAKKVKNNRKIKNKKNNVCKCGCGEEIIIKKHHRYVGVPDYIHGHYIRGKRNPMKRPNVVKKNMKGKNYKKIGEKIRNTNTKNGTYKATSKRMKQNNPMYNPKFARKSGQAQHNRYLSGSLVTWNKNKTFYEDSRILAGKKHPSYIDGRSRFPDYGNKWNKKLREFIRKRDNYRCQECFRHQNELIIKCKDGKFRRYKLCVHHIDYNKKNNQENNLISLCTSCNARVNFGRVEWTNYFQNKIMEK